MTVDLVHDLSSALGGTSIPDDPRVLVLAVGMMLTVVAARAVVVLVRIVQQLLRALGLLVAALVLVVALGYQLLQEEGSAAGTPTRVSTETPDIPPLGSFVE